MFPVRWTLIATTTGVAISTAPACAQSQYDEWRTDFTTHTVPLDEIVSGGPPKDGIPSIDSPTFVTVDEADEWLDHREPVVVVTVDEVAKAYPLQILIWHEIVNDVVSDVPIAVTYCPLCNTALAFDRRLDSLTLDFGTTGRLRHSDLVMYDRQTETWWQQATGQGIVGIFAGRELTFIGAPTVSWRTFEQEYPDGLVLSRETGYERPYGRNPYVGYDNPRGGPFARFFKREPDHRLAAMERVVAVQLGSESAAFPFSTLATQRVMNEEVGEEPIVVFWASGTASALDAAAIGAGRDVGSSGVFSRRFGTRVLEFEAVDNGSFRDSQTGTTWNVLGVAIAGPLASFRLEAIPHGNHFWFAWAAFRADTRIVR